MSVFPNFSDLRAEAVHILTTPIVVLSAWEKAGGWGSHGTITHFDGQLYGKVSTRSFESNLPVGAERITAANAHYTAVEVYALAIIRYLVPAVCELEQAGAVRVSGGQIEIRFESESAAREWAQAVRSAGGEK